MSGVTESARAAARSFLAFVNRAKSPFHGRHCMPRRAARWML